MSNPSFVCSTTSNSSCTLCMFHLYIQTEQICIHNREILRMHLSRLMFRLLVQNEAVYYLLVCHCAFRYKWWKILVSVIWNSISHINFAEGVNNVKFTNDDSSLSIAYWFADGTKRVVYFTSTGIDCWDMSTNKYLWRKWFNDELPWFKHRVCSILELSECTRFASRESNRVAVFTFFIRI